METNQSVSQNQVRRKPEYEGPRKHLLAYVFSLLLTGLAFIAVMYKDNVEASFVPMFIVSLACIQAVLQALYWMHLKDRGHLFQRIFLSGGAIISFTCIVMGIYWVWW